MTMPVAASGTCQHRQIERWGNTDANVFLWACRDCNRRFYPACTVCIVDGHRGELHPLRLTVTAAPESEPDTAEAECGHPSSASDATCILPAGHAADSATRFHHFKLAPRIADLSTRGTT